MPAVKVIAAFACMLVPLGLWRLLLPDTAPATKVLAMVAVSLVVLSLLGVAAAS